MEPSIVVLGTSASRRADDLAAGDAISCAHGEAGEEGVRRAEPTVVADDDVQRPRDRPRERNYAVRRRPHGRARPRREVDAAMAGPVREGRRPERPSDLALDRGQPRPAAAGRGRGAGEPRAARHEERGSRQAEDETDDDLPAGLVQAHGRSRGSCTTRGSAGEASRSEARRDAGIVSAGYDNEKSRGDDGGVSTLGRFYCRPAGRAAGGRPLVWIWHTRLSVTPSTSPISDSVSPS